MRKSSVNRLREISGGVCAPDGFTANGVACGIKKGEGKKDLALVATERRCPSACVFSVYGAQSVTARVSKKHLKNGFAQGILINSGVANLFVENGEWIAERSCRILARHSHIEVNETLLASTGCVGEKLTIEPFERGIPPLAKGLTHSETGSLAAAEAIMTVDKAPKQAAFEFDLGDFPCKIGAIYKGSARVCPNMATLLVILTTDVNVSAAMLQKALSAAVRDSFNLLCLDGISSPNDTVCIMANGKAGNYQIFCEDSEYDKFVNALRDMLIELAKRIVRESAEGGPALFCKVSGTRSKQVARALARDIVCSKAVNTMIMEGSLRALNLINLINTAVEDADYKKTRISIVADGQTFVLFNNGYVFSLPEDIAKKMRANAELTMSIELNGGNFGATSFGLVCSVSNRE